MKNVVIGFPKSMLDDLDHYVEARRYPSRSEAVRDAVRRQLAKEAAT